MKNFVLICLCVIASCFFLGCKNDTIKFQRNSSVSEFMQNIGIEQKADIKKSSGIVIYKDESKPEQQINAPTTNFGPRDINFDMPIRFK